MQSEAVALTDVQTTSSTEEGDAGEVVTKFAPSKHMGWS